MRTCSGPELSVVEVGQGSAAPPQGRFALSLPWALPPHPWYVVSSPSLGCYRSRSFANRGTHPGGAEEWGWEEVTRTGGSEGWKGGRGQGLTPLALLVFGPDSSFSGAVLGTVGHSSAPLTSTHDMSSLSPAVYNQKTLSLDIVEAPLPLLRTMVWSQRPGRTGLWAP